MFCISESARRQWFVSGQQILLQDDCISVSARRCTSALMHRMVSCWMRNCPPVSHRVKRWWASSTAYRRWFTNCGGLNRRVQRRQWIDSKRSKNVCDGDNEYTAVRANVLSYLASAVSRQQQRIGARRNGSSDFTGVNAAATAVACAAAGHNDEDSVTVSITQSLSLSPNHRRRSICLVPRILCSLQPDEPFQVFNPDCIWSDHADDVVAPPF